MSAQQQKAEVVVFQPPRLPYHEAIKERFGVDRAGWKALTEAIFPSAESADSVVMALSYCRARNLDPFKRPVHIVPMWSRAQNKWVETVWPGIAELRTTAFRTGQYGGMEPAEFGPVIEREFSGGSGNNQRAVKVKFPEWCQIKVWRTLKADGQRVMFASPKVYWLETYARWKSTEVPNDMWAKRPFGQLEKCTEAAGLRRAFPEELGNDLAAEEMEGRLLEEGRHVEDSAPARDSGPPLAPARQVTAQPQPSPPADPAATVEAGREEEGQLVWDDGMDIPASLDRRNDKPAAAPANAINEEQWLRDLEGAFSSCEDMISLGEKQRDNMKPMKGTVSKETWAKAQALAEAAFHRIQTGLG